MAALQMKPELSWRGRLDSVSHGRRRSGRNANGSGFVVAGQARRIEGVSEELNAIARQNLDFAVVRRRVRWAFAGTQQELDHLLFKRAPSGIQMEEWYEVNSRGLEVFCKSWFPPPSSKVRIKGAVFFCHGYGDTCTFFFEGIAKRIAAEGYGVFAMDYPGFGLSQGLHGYIPSFDELVEDVIEQYTKIKGKPLIRKLPHFIFGQSMGGAVALKLHLEQPSMWDGIVLVAPMCKIAEDIMPPDFMVKIAKFLSVALPKVKLFPNEDLSHFTFQELAKRRLAQVNVVSYKDKVRVRTAMELLKTTKEIERQLDKVSAPLLILHGSEDKVTDPQVSQFLYHKASSQDKTIKLYRGGYHCILEGESDERILEVINDIISWLDVQSVINKN
ncbi:caffeoylshikimate esterase-like [Nymphaea colorata]|nr:caffeoylshikimate esterase-like [Nymphaea colorata]